MRVVQGCLWSFWASDGAPWGLKCMVWSPLMWMRLGEAKDWIWVRILGRCNMSLMTFKAATGNASFWGVFGPFEAQMGALEPQMYSMASQGMDEIA